MFGVSVNTIRWSNDLSSTGVIRVGQTLVILPVNGVRYTVKKGDTVASIAKKFKGDADEILNYNVLSLEDGLSVGQSIVIPDGVVAAPPIVPRATSKNNVAKYSGPELVGYYLRPVPGPKTQGIHGNNGVDMGNPIGTTVVASAPGEVIIARSSGWNGGYGQMVVITHPNGTQTLYGHLSQVDVSAGMYVVQGQRIGAVGNTGRSTGPHLHFEVRGAKNPF
jgi:murein DD-endopeptidase MepM/ murein hydrolase activator NlpD